MDNEDDTKRIDLTSAIADPVVQARLQEDLDTRGAALVERLPDGHLDLNEGERKARP